MAYLPYIERHQIGEVKRLTREKRAERIERQYRERYGSEVRMYGTVYEAKRREQRYADWIARGGMINELVPTDYTVKDIWGIIQTSIIEHLFKLQDGNCYLCGDPFGEHRLATREHVTPKALGGKNDRNILLACRDCNEDKADRAPTPAELKYLAFINKQLDALGLRG